VAQWAVGEDNFAADPPNAALSILIGTEPQEIIMELMSPRIEGRDLVYDVKILQGNEKATGETVSLFIDPVGRPMSPTSVAGVHRRTCRRVVRRAVR